MSRSAPLPRPALLLAGYGNAPFERLCGSLAPLGIDLALDVRLIPSGWEPRYSGQRFLDELVAGEAALVARHAAGLGNSAKRDGGSMRLADPSQLTLLAERLDDHRIVCLICGCAEVARCHRALIARELLALRPGTAIYELGRVGRDGDLPTPTPFDAAGAHPERAA